MDVAVLIPVLGRPHTISPVVESIRDTAPQVRVVLIATVGDSEVFVALRDMAATNTSDFDVLTMPKQAVGDYAKKINHAAAHIDADVFFLGASDLRFHPGWLEEGLVEMEVTGAGVVGTNDLGNRRVTSGEHSTHSFVARWYMDEYGLIDQPGKILFEGYIHEFVDDELVGTAKHRDMYAWAENSIVEHLHPLWGKAADDDMYRRANHRMRTSRHLYNQRRKKWTSR